MGDLTAAVVLAQMLMYRSHLWLPGWLQRRSVSRVVITTFGLALVSRDGVLAMIAMALAVATGVLGSR